MQQTIWQGNILDHWLIEFSKKYIDSKFWNLRRLNSHIFKVHGDENVAHIKCDYKRIAHWQLKEHVVILILTLIEEKNCITGP